MVNVKTDETIRSFLSLLECVKYLSIACPTANNRALKGKSFLFPSSVEASKGEGRLVYLKMEIN